MAETRNPRWIGDEHHWDIALSNGAVHIGITRRDISATLQRMLSAGLIATHDSHVDIVRQCHIDLYDKYQTSEVGSV